jgi:hypothetical protein
MGSGSPEKDRGDGWPDGDHLLSDEKEAERRDMQDDFASRRAGTFRIRNLRLPNWNDGSTSTFQSDDEVVLRLIPRSKMLSRVIASIRIHQDPVEGMRVGSWSRAAGINRDDVLRVILNPNFLRTPLPCDWDPRSGLRKRGDRNGTGAMLRDDVPAASRARNPAGDPGRLKC